MQGLPNAITDRWSKVKQLRDIVLHDAISAMDIGMNQFKGHVAQMRQCCDIIEGSVLVLGVPTTHSVVSKLVDAIHSSEVLLGLWRTCDSMQKDFSRQNDQLLSAMEQAYLTLRERRDRLEKDLRAMSAEYDRKDGALDRAVEYVQAVLTERATWQSEVGGHNVQQLPLLEVPFSQRCTVALDALYAARLPPPPPSSSLTTVIHDDKSEPSRDTIHLRGSGSGRTSVSGVNGSTASAAVVPLRKYGPVQSWDTSASAVERWRATIDSRCVDTQPSVRFAYVPPAEEVEVLRDVLAMGTGSTALLKDIRAEETRLQMLKDNVRIECQRSMIQLQEVRGELLLFKQFMRDLMASRAPFVLYQSEILTAMRRQINKEVEQNSRSRRHLSYTASMSSAESPIHNVHKNDFVFSADSSSLM